MCAGESGECVHVCRGEWGVCACVQGESGMCVHVCREDPYSPWLLLHCPRYRRLVFHGWIEPRSSLHTYAPSVGAVCGGTVPDAQCG